MGLPSKIPAPATAEQLRSMLFDVLDAHYGGSIHHIGDGDGLSPEQVLRLQEWWKAELQRYSSQSFQSKLQS